MIVLTREQIRRVDQIAGERYGIPGIVLMENAGHGATAALFDRLTPPLPTPILVLAGRGNNGGDGFVVARHLAVFGHTVRVGITGDPASFRSGAESAVNFCVLERMGLPIVSIGAEGKLEEELDRAELVVDALLGTGLTGEVRGLTRSVIEEVNASRIPVFALDAPSGLDCDTGRPLGVSITARATATFGAMKKGFIERDASRWTGTVDVVGLGAPIVWE